MARRQSCARILMYHGVGVEAAPALANQVRYLARNFKIVSFAVMVDRLAANRAIAANEIALTFDDGLRNNLTVVYPILKELQLPATFFVCPALIGSGQWLWNHEMRCRLKTLSNDALVDIRTTLLAPDPSANGIVEWMKTLRLPQRRRAEECIRLATPVFNPTAAQRQAYDIMDWNELRSLDPGLIMIGSHTMTHPILTTLSTGEISSELRDSRILLEKELDRGADFFCYPNGSYDARVYDAVKNHYRAAVTTETGVLNGKDPLDLHRLPRIPSAENPALTAWRLHRPEA